MLLNVIPPKFDSKNKVWYIVLNKCNKYEPTCTSRITSEDYLSILEYYNKYMKSIYNRGKQR